MYASSTGIDTAWFVKIWDVGPDGEVKLLAKGHLKASFREVDETMSEKGKPFHPFKNPVLPEPNKIYEYQIGIWPIFYTFKKGHKIWAQIANIDYSYQNHLNTIYTSEIAPFPAENNIFHDLAHPSHLILPVIPDSTIIKPEGPPVSQIMWQPEVKVS